MDESLCVFAFLRDSYTGKADAPGVFDQGERPRSVNANICTDRLKMSALRVSARFFVMLFTAHP